MTNHTTKIVISTYLIICSGLNIKCQRFILLLICILAATILPPLTPSVQVHSFPPPCCYSHFAPPLLFCQLLLLFSPLHSFHGLNKLSSRKILTILLSAFSINSHFPCLLCRHIVLCAVAVICHLRATGMQRSHHINMMRVPRRGASDLVCLPCSIHIQYILYLHN